MPTQGAAAVVMQSVETFMRFSAQEMEAPDAAASKDKLKTVLKRANELRRHARSEIAKLREFILSAIGKFVVAF